MRLIRRLTYLQLTMLFVVAVAGYRLAAPLAAAAFTPAVTITIDQQNPIIAINGTQQFTAMVSGTATTTVTWAVNNLAGGNAAVGTIDAAGKYKAPATLPGVNPVTITATSVADPTATATTSLTVRNPTPSIGWWSPGKVPLGQTTFSLYGSNFVNDAVAKLNGVALPTTFVNAGQLNVISNVAQSGSGYVTVSNPGATNPTSTQRLVEFGQGIIVTVAPVTSTLAPGAKQQFTATATGAPTNQVWWYVNGGSANGTISSSGLYTAPNTAPANPVTILAVCTANSERSGSATVIVSGSAVPPTVAISINPTSAAMLTGATQQFTATVTGSANTAVTWRVNSITGGNATVGTISNTGLYTAPAAVPATPVTVTAVSQADATKQATATITLTPALTVAVAPNAASIQVGATQQFTATVTGNANQAVTWQVNGVTGGDPANGTISAAGLYTAPNAIPVAGYVTITAISQVNNVTKGSTTLSLQDPLAITYARFLDQTSFGPTPASIAQARQMGMQAFLTDQFNQPESAWPTTANVNRSAVIDAFFANAYQGQDQLRQRVIFALSEITVVAFNKNTNGNEVAPWLQLLSRNAFGNYKTLLKELTLDGSMGKYLDLVNSGGSGAPNENYPREVMQLFSMGLFMLNQDGSLMLDANGNPIPTYTQTDVQQLAKALTGWTYTNATNTSGPGGNYSYYPGPMIPAPGKHNATAKTFLGQTLPAGQTIQQDLDGAINIIFSHPNVAPFISTRLIRALVTSNPSPQYIKRVADVFQSTNGDMKSVITAIILDQEARNDAPPANFGRLRTPVQHTIALARALNLTLGPASNFAYLFTQMNEGILDAPSVFGHYSPLFRIPKGGGLFGPEFQIYSPSDAINRANYFYSLLYNPWPINPALQPFIAVAGNATQLVNAVDNALLFGRMLPSTRATLLNAMPAMTDNNQRVLTALYLTATSGEHAVQR